MTVFGGDGLKVVTKFRHHQRQTKTNALRRAQLYVNRV